METKAFEVATPDGPMAVYEAIPDGNSRGGLIVIQEAFGVNGHIEDVTRRAAAEGWHAVAPHLFHRSGGGTVDYPGDDPTQLFKQLAPHFEALDDDKILDDVDATLGVLSSRGIPASRTAVVGFCMGGRVAFLVAARRALGAAAGFYGGIVTTRFPQMPALVGEAATLQTPWLGLFGDLDQGIPVTDVETLRAALVAAPVPTEIVRYPNADHGFHCDERPVFEPEAAADGWRRTMLWFDKYVGSATP